MTTLYLIRHGQTIWNVQKKMQGWNDSPLSELGIQQAEWLSERLENVSIDIIYSSPLGRALKTAEIVRGTKNIDIISRDNLREINGGMWEGKEQEYIEKEFKEQLNNYWNAPHLYVPYGGENFEQVRDRAVKEIENIINENEGKNILVVTHGATLKCFMSYVRNISIKDLWEPPYIHQTSLTKIEVDNKKMKVIMYADTSHYREVEVENVELT